MDRRTFLLGLSGSLALAPTMIVAASSVEAASSPEPLRPTAEPGSASAGTEANLDTVRAEWSHHVVPGLRHGRSHRRGRRRGR